jgi:hypothetical protein
MILNSFARFIVPALVERSTPVFVNNMPHGFTWATVATYRVLFWEGSSARSFVSDKFKESVDASAGFDLGSDVQEGDRVTIDTRVFFVTHPDNVGLANKYKLVGMKEYDNGTA